LKASNDVIQKLKNDATLDSLLGATSNPKIYPLIAPQDEAYPFIVYSLADEGTPMEIIEEFDMRFNVYDEDYEKIQDIVKRLRELLGLQDTVDIPSTNGFRFDYGKLTSAIDIRDDEANVLYRSVVFHFVVARIS
jgi:hypothetical protein